MWPLSVILKRRELTNQKQALLELKTTFWNPLDMLRTLVSQMSGVAYHFESPTTKQFKIKQSKLKKKVVGHRWYMLRLELDVPVSVNVFVRWRLKVIRNCRWKKSSGKKWQARSLVDGPRHNIKHWMEKSAKKLYFPQKLTTAFISK